jgi:hypothetical protein
VKRVWIYSFAYLKSYVLLQVLLAVLCPPTTQFEIVRKRIPVITGSAIPPRSGCKSQIRSNGNNQFKTSLVYGFKAESLHFQVLADKLFTKYKFLL